MKINTGTIAIVCSVLAGGWTGGAAGAAPEPADRGLLVQLQASLVPFDGDGGDGMGNAVALSGGTAVIGVSHDDDNGLASGSVVVWVLSSGVWYPQQRLRPSDAFIGDQFGYSVAIIGSTVVVGAPGDDDLGSGAGSAYVFVNAGGVWSLQQKLTAADGAAGDSFGWSVSVSGDTLLVGAPGADVGGDSNQGAAYVFVRTSGVWTQQQKLSTGNAGDACGRAVSVSVDTAAIGAPLRDSFSTDNGYVYVYVRSGVTWSLQQTLASAESNGSDEFGAALSLDGIYLAVGSPMNDLHATNAGLVEVFARSGTTWSAYGGPVNEPNASAEDHFGQSVGFSSGKLAVGVPNDDDGGANAGMVEVFTFSASTWSLSRTLYAADRAAGDNFGASVALYNDVPLAGAPGADESGTDSGSAYVFATSGPYTDQQELVFFDLAARRWYGMAVAIDGDTAVVGNNQADDLGVDSGAAFVFVRSGGAWTLQQKLLAADGADGDMFGISVAISGNYIAVGANSDDVGAASNQGSVYVFVRASGAWSEQQKLVASDGATDDQFGYAVTISGSTLAAGAKFDHVGANSDQGSAYLFSRVGSTWTETDKLTAGDGAQGDLFGGSVSLAPVGGNRLAIGAETDDDLGAESGSVYVYLRSGLTWSFQRKLTASDGEAGDRFGRSVSVSGTTVAVGALNEDTLGADAGAAYVYFYNGTFWTEQGKLTAADGEAGDAFGGSVSLAGDALAIGASGDDDLGSGSGAAYLFTRSASLWSQQAKLSPPAGAANDSFGQFLALSGATLLVGRPGSDALALDAGEALVYLITAATDGTPCPGPYPCESGFCVDGVCCDTPCTGGPGDCMACSVAAGASVDGTCAVLPNTWVCNPSAGDCDVEERCDGGNFDCPADAFLPGDVECRASAGDCDVPESCSGSSADCPTDGLLPAGTECRPVAGVCDAPESCTGSSADCPVDQFQPNLAIPCRPWQGLCDVDEYCPGDGPDCPADRFASVASVCRGVAGDCDQEENCTGDSADCPNDAFLAAATECRASAGDCDPAEACTGADVACPADALLPAGAGCRAAAGACDAPESCTGADVACPPDALLAAGSECRGVAGLCDLAEACDGADADCPADAFLPAATECRQAACAAGVEIDPADCTGGAAECPAETTSPCAPYACGLDACLATCAAATDCAPGFECQAGQCRSPGNLGDPCVTAVDCQSTFCVDGFCCDLACAGQCEACDLAGAEGACSPVEGAPHGERTPCTSDGSACGGACDGTAPDACAYPDDQVPCREASCANAVAVLPAACQATGACPAEQTQDCAPEGCDGDHCAGGCNLDADCGAGQYCSAGVCTDKLAQGEGCSGDPQCLSGPCVDGFCCDGACMGQCEACDMTGLEGTCSPVEGAPHGGRTACTGQGICAGACDGGARDACAFPATGTECAAATCADGLLTPAGVCDGAGSCSVGSQEPCAPYVCGESSCLTTCAGPEDCASGYECSDGECRQLEASSGCGCGATGDDAGRWGGAALGLVGLVLLLRRRFAPPHRRQVASPS